MTNKSGGVTFHPPHPLDVMSHKHCQRHVHALQNTVISSILLPSIGVFYVMDDLQVFVHKKVIKTVG